MKMVWANDAQTRTQSIFELTAFVFIPNSAIQIPHSKGGDRIRLGHHKSRWRAVVDQQAT